MKSNNKVYVCDNGSLPLMIHRTMSGISRLIGISEVSLRLLMKDKSECMVEGYRVCRGVIVERNREVLYKKDDSGRFVSEKPVNQVENPDSYTEKADNYTEKPVNDMVSSLGENIPAWARDLSVPGESLDEETGEIFDNKPLVEEMVDWGSIDPTEPPEEVAVCEGNKQKHKQSRVSRGDTVFVECKTCNHKYNYY